MFARCLPGVLFLTLVGAQCLGAIVYVNGAAPGADPDGATWAAAFPTVQQGINTAGPDYSEWLDETNPRSWVPPVTADPQGNDPDDNPDPGTYSSPSETTVLDGATGNVTSIPFNPNQYRVEGSPPPNIDLQIHPDTPNLDADRYPASLYAYPNTAICKILCSYGGGLWGEGSGVLLDSARKFVLTAGHVLYRKVNGKPIYPPKVWIIPMCFNDPQSTVVRGKPYTGSTTFTPVGVAHYKWIHYFRDNDKTFEERDDMAIIKLGGGDDVSRAWWVPPYSFELVNLSPTHRSFTMAGYPYDPAVGYGWKMYAGEGHTTDWYSPGFFYGNYQVTTDLSVTYGDSGSPAITSEPGWQAVFGILRAFNTITNKSAQSDSKMLSLNKDKIKWVLQELAR